MAQPIVKYTLNKKGQVPEWINSSDSSFSGEHGITGNKTGYIPKYESPQETIYLGIASGDPDPDGTPDDYVGTFANKTALTTYLKTVGNTVKYKTVTETVTGIQTATTVGLATVWNNTENYQGGLSTSTTTKHTVAGVGTVATINASQVTKVEVKTDTTEGIQPLKTTTTPIVIDAASTLSGVSTSVGIVTTTGTDAAGLAVTTTTTTDTTSFTYTDVRSSSSTSTSETTTDGVTTRTDTVTTTESTNYDTSYDYATEATRLWDIYTALNS